MAKKKRKPRKKMSKEDREVEALKKKASALTAELANVRKKILQNELILRRKIGKKIPLENELSNLLRKSFSSEKSALTRVKSSAKRKEAQLKEKIASLERINAIYEAKKARILEAKKRQAALKKQLDILEKQAEIWGEYA